jgi:hypothetical protein
MRKIIEKELFDCGITRGHRKFITQSLLLGSEDSSDLTQIST